MSGLSPRKLLPWTTLVAALLWCGLTPTETKAGAVTFNTVPGKDSDGPLAASITFTAIKGGIEITITNTETGTIAKGQAISDLKFTMAGGLNTPTAFNDLQGWKVNSASFKPGSSFPGSATATQIGDSTTKTGPDSIDHWGFNTVGKTVLLATAGTGAPGGKPTYMILPSTGTTGPGKSLADGKNDPYLLGPTNFFLKVAGVTANTKLTAANFTGVTVGFGTGTDKVLAASAQSAAVPEPSTMAVAGLGALAFIGYGLRRRLKK